MKQYCWLSALKIFICIFSHTFELGYIFASRKKNISNEISTMSYWYKCTEVRTLSFCCIQGVLGSLRSGKSALVNRFITGSYLPLELHEGENFVVSHFCHENCHCIHLEVLLLPYRSLLSSFSSLEGGRYKKEVLVEGQSHLLLIREESGPPSAQVGLFLQSTLET